MQKSIFNEQKQPSSINEAEKRLTWLRVQVRKMYNANNIGKNEIRDLGRDDSALRTYLSSEKEFTTLQEYQAEITFLKEWIIEQIYRHHLYSKVPAGILNIKQVTMDDVNNQPTSLEDAERIRRSIAEKRKTIDSLNNSLRLLKEDLIKNIYRQLVWAKAGHISTVYHKILDELKPIREFYQQQASFIKEWIKTENARLRKEKTELTIEQNDLTSHQKIVVVLLKIIKKIQQSENTLLNDEEREIIDALCDVYLT